MIRNLIQHAQHGAGLRKRQGRKLKPVKPSHKNELWYKGQLLAIVAQLRKVAREELLPELKRLEPLYAKAADGMARDGISSFSPIVIAKIADLKRRFGGIDGVARLLAEAATRRSLQTVDERLAASINSSLGIDISGFISRTGPIQQVSEAAMQANARLIKSIPEQYFDKLGDAIGKNMDAGLRFEDLAKEVERIGDVTESRAKLIARDQTSKMNGAFNQIRQLSLGIEQYTWQTSGDERVRDDHSSNDGETFRWDKAPATGHPGEAVNCRCMAIPIVNLDEPAEDGSGWSGGGLAAAAIAAGTIGAMFSNFAGDGFASRGRA